MEGMTTTAPGLVVGGCNSGHVLSILGPQMPTRAEPRRFMKPTNPIKHGAGLEASLIVQFSRMTAQRS